MNYNEESLKVHEQKKGKIEVISKVSVNNKDDLSIAYTPGVAEPCRKIAENKNDVYKYTAKGNLVGIVTDGSAVLGLGNIGPEASLPVMEGKAILLKEFANVDAFPICLETQDVSEIVETVKRIAPVFGGINLEDISAPRCIEIENKLKEILDIPVFHDDQHGTAVVCTAGLLNSLKIVNKEIDKIKIVVNGAGAAGGAIIKMLLSLGAKNIIACDKKGILQKNDPANDFNKDYLANVTNIENQKGQLKDAIIGADIFIGVSAPNVLTEEMVKSMSKDPVIFALANPIPEIMPELAIKAGAKIVATGRSDFANQINNVLAFPGIFRGALDVKATEISEEMKKAAAMAIAEMVSDEELSPNFIIPDPLNKNVAKKVAAAVADIAVKTGKIRK